MSDLQYASVPECDRSRTWNGEWGVVKVQGPEPAPAGWQPPPDPKEVVAAMVVTEWSCYACGEDNDVWGEGAIESWMQCSSCGESSYLSMDKFFAEMRPTR